MRPRRVSYGLEGQYASSHDDNGSGRGGEEQPYNVPDDEEQNDYLQGSGAMQFDDDSSEEGHTRLFVIIDEGMPRFNEHHQLTTAELAQRKEQVEITWEKIRRWLWVHQDPEERGAAASVRGNNDATPLHNVCKLPNPPRDIVQALLEAAPDTSTWVDSHGWLPLHHACANGASGEVLQLLTDAYPEGKTRQDSQDRTPLHFFLTQPAENTGLMANNMGMLSDSGAAELPDVGGMLPMHYACAYGVNPAVLRVLAESYPDSLIAKENKGRTPMHLAMVNAHRKRSPGVIRFLLENTTSDIVNLRDHEGFLPLHLLALGIKGFRSDEVKERNNVSECLKMYLAAEPIASADFLRSLQDLPDWLQDVAVVSPHVRNILNQKIVQRLPTMFLMMDFYFLFTVIVCFEIATREQIDARFKPDTETSLAPVIILFVCGSYFLGRELIQIVSLWSLGSFSSWFYDPENWLDMLLIALIFFFSIVMTDPNPLPCECIPCQCLTDSECFPGNSGCSPDFADACGLDDMSNMCRKIGGGTFRSLAAMAKGVFWLSFIYFLKSTLVDFAVFVGGVFYVLQRLLAFLSAVVVILLAFAQMFYYVYIGTDICNDDLANMVSDPTLFPHCTFDASLLKVYTMMMGEIGDETRYETQPVAQLLYVAYAFLVVILLSNVLIAIVTDSYEIIQNDRAAIVFWSNRLDFVAEVDAIANLIWKKLNFLSGSQDAGPGTVQESPYSSGATTHNEIQAGQEKDIFYSGWKALVQLFDQNVYDDIEFSPQNIEFWCFFFFRGAALLFVIPCWILLGLISAGWLWPPQIREYLFVQRETAISRADLEKQKLEQLKEIQNNIQNLRADLRKEMANDRDELVRMRNEVEAIQTEVMSDLQQLRELMTTLLHSGDRSGN